LRGDRLREAREKLGISQRELSRMCGLGFNMVYRYENGLSDITGDTLKVIAGKLNVNTDYLLGLSDDPHFQIREPQLNEEERIILETFRRNGWSGVVHLGVEKLSK
jgi:transcriptional regulator with XRE-family HTH domain